MRLHRFLMPLWLALAFFGPAAGAQEAEASHYDGTWTVRLRCPDGSNCAARLVLRDFEGTWQDLQGKRSAKSACGAKKIPLTVQSSKLSHLEFTVWGENISPGCPTLSVLVKPVNAKVLEGRYELGVHEGESSEVHAGHSQPAPDAPPVRNDTGKAAVSDAGTARTVRLERR